MKKVGEISQGVIDLLELKVEAGTPVFIGDSNIAHMMVSHLEDYESFKDHIPDIISVPDYVGVNPNDKSVEYVKIFVVENKYVKVAVRVSIGGVCGIQRTERAAVAPSNGLGDAGRSPCLSP